MAGFEVVVRPAILPNIRPAPPRVLPPVNDPAQGMAVITGSGGNLIDLPHSFSVSLSRSLPQQEETRVVNKERVYQKDKNGKINKSNFIDVERLKKVRFNNADGATKVLYADPPKLPNVETLETDVTRTPA
jgi:hypothetical protein